MHEQLTKIMTDKKLNIINGITNSMHDQDATINEEMVDGNTEEVVRTIESLKKDLDHLKTNVTTNGI